MPPAKQDVDKRTPTKDKRQSHRNRAEKAYAKFMIAGESTTLADFKKELEDELEDSKIRILEEVVDLKIEIYDNMIRDIRHDRTMKQADRDEAVKTMTGMISRLKHDLTDHQREERDEWTARNAPLREQRRNVETPQRSTEERRRDTQDRRRDTQIHPTNPQEQRENFVIHLDDSDDDGLSGNQRPHVPLTPLSPPLTPLHPDLGRSSLKRKHATVKVEEDDDNLFLGDDPLAFSTSPKWKRTYQDDAIEELRRDALASKHTKPKPTPKGFRVPRALPRFELSPTRKIFGRSESMDGVERQRPTYRRPPRPRVSAETFLPRDRETSED